MPSPTLQRATIRSGGRTIALQFDTAVVNATEPTNLPILVGSSNAALTYLSGEGTRTITYNIGRTVFHCEDPIIAFRGSTIVSCIPSLAYGFADFAFAYGNVAFGFPPSADDDLLQDVTFTVRNMSEMHAPPCGGDGEKKCVWPDHDFNNLRWHRSGRSNQFDYRPGYRR